MQRTRDKKKATSEERRNRVQAAGSTIDLTQDVDEEEELERVMELSREEAEFQKRAGQRYEHGGGSGSGSGGGGMKGLLRRTFSKRDTSSHVDFNLSRAKSPVQQMIDTGPWTSKGKSAKDILGRTWAKWFHVAGIPGRKADDPFFISAIKQTQQWGKTIFLQFSASCDFCILFESMFCLIIQVRGYLLQLVET